MTAIVISIIIAAVLTVFFVTVSVFVRRSISRARLTVAPYSVKLARSCLDIENMNGDATLTREFVGIAPSVRLDRISGTIETSGSFDVPPHLRPPVPNDLQFSTRQHSEGEIEYIVEFVNGLAAGTKRDVLIDARLKNTVRMKKEAIAAAYANDSFKNEYHSMSVPVPIGSLELEVRFPAGFVRETTSVVVFQGDSETEVTAESERLRSSLQVSETAATLIVDQPRLVYRYGIYWVPA